MLSSKHLYSRQWFCNVLIRASLSQWRATVNYYSHRVFAAVVLKHPAVLKGVRLVHSWNDHLNNGVGRDAPIALQILVWDHLSPFLLQICSLLNQKHRNRRQKHSFWLWIPSSHGKMFIFVLQMEDRWRKVFSLETREARLVHGWNCSFSLPL